MFRLLNLLLLISVLDVCHGAFYKDCGSTYATLNSLTVSNCKNTSNICILRRNTNVTFEIDFTTKDKVIETVNTVVHGIVMDLPVPFPLLQPDGCIGCGLECPLKTSTRYAYHTEMPILKSYPSLHVQIKWQFQYKKGDEKDIICALISAKLQ